MERFWYLLRRLFLAIPVFLGITVLCFSLTRFLPGGPVEARLMRLKASDSGAGSVAAQQVSDEYRKQLEKAFGFDKPLAVQYWNWLVEKRMGLMLKSYDYPDKTAWELIRSRIPVSVGFGLTAFLATYLVCIPLGIAKALRNRTVFDAASSVAVFVAYAIPSFALAMTLRMCLCGTVDGLWNVFPLGGIASDFDEPMPWYVVAADCAKHMVLPVACYVAGSFAMLTLLMKNSLLDEISADYMRTVIAKGASRRRAVWRHALRNALVPVAVGFGPMLGMVFAGSIIIEKIFEIPGMGRLSWDALNGRDYAVFLALLSLTSLIGLIGNLVSDFLYMAIDPRIDFSRK